MGFDRVNPLGWGLYEELTSAQMNQIDIHLSNAASDLDLADVINRLISTVETTNVGFTVVDLPEYTEFVGGYGVGSGGGGGGGIPGLDFRTGGGGGGGGWPFSFFAKVPAGQTQIGLFVDLGGVGGGFGAPGSDGNSSRVFWPDAPGSTSGETIAQANGGGGGKSTPSDGGDGYSGGGGGGTTTPAGDGGAGGQSGGAGAYAAGVGQDVRGGLIDGLPGGLGNGTQAGGGGGGGQFDIATRAADADGSGGEGGYGYGAGGGGGAGGNQGGDGVGGRGARGHVIAQFYKSPT